jgi:ABC-type lipoprotein export system ATPase subunit
VVRIRDGRLSEQWSPAAPEDEVLVVDDRGWIRLPDRLRRGSGAGRGVRAALELGRIVLTGIEHHGSVESTKAPEPVCEGRSTGPVAQLKNIRLAYVERMVLDGVDLDVPPGAVTVVRGRSGSGKSSLLRVLTGLADPDDGIALLAGVGLSALDRSARAELRRRHVAVATQAGALAESLDIGENLALARQARGLSVDDQVVDEVIGALALYPVRRRAVRLLSGGERQRVTVARSLVVQRPLVVLDEPTSQQDEAHAHLVASALRRAARGGSAVLCATHDPVLVESADRVLDLD